MQTTEKLSQLGYACNEPTTRKYSVHPEPYPFDTPGFWSFSFKGLMACWVLAPAVTCYMLGYMHLYPICLVLGLLPIYVIVIVFDSVMKNWAFGESIVGMTPGLELSKYLTFKNDSLANAYKEGKIPMETFYEAYFDEKVDINGDMLELLEARHDWASFPFTWGHAKFFFNRFVGDVYFHSRKQDETQVREHYDRGNDFYEAFLGPMMIYTSGIINHPERRESLEELQENKMNLVCEKINLKEGEKLLDIGCGWGTLLSHAASKYKAYATGVTLAKEQTAFGLNRAKQFKVSDKVKILNHDYRDIPVSTAPNGVKYDKITCLEMAEHVGVFRFNTFLMQVRELLNDDGLFYLQIAGLRRSWQYEDLCWGLFMNKYIFPGADASTPLSFYINQLEYAGFEVYSSETVGVHYSATLERWYQNWMKPENKAKITEKYGMKWWRIWEFFLAWSVIASRQGSATCYQIVAHKNSCLFQRKNLIQRQGLKRLIA